MNKTIAIIIGVVGILFLCITLFFCIFIYFIFGANVDNTKTPTRDSNNNIRYGNTNNYKNISYGYSLDLPAGWVASNNSEASVMIYKTSDKYYIDVLVADYDLSKYSKVDSKLCSDFQKIYREQISKTGVSLNKVNFVLAKLNGYDICKANFDLDNNNTQQILYSGFYFVPNFKGGNAYGITYVADTRDLEKEFQKIIDTFELE
jgi:hypothetical protein